jgi:Uma2 family endonuclease
MTTTAEHVTLAQYLDTSYRPDQEWIDGELKERNVGKYEHARLQAFLSGWFLANEKKWGVQVVTEQRTRVAPRRIRIPDVMLLPRGPQPEVIVDSPVLVVEILSPDDTYADTQDRAGDYLAMPAQAVWLIDPTTRSARMCLHNAWVAANRLVVPGTEIFVEVSELFESLGKSVEDK